MNERKKLASNTGALLCLQIANYVLPFVIIPFLTRSLGVGIYGVVAFGLALTQIACVVTDFGFNLSATRQIAHQQNEQYIVRKIIGAVFTCKVLLLPLACMLIPITLLTQGEKYGEYQVYFWLLTVTIIGQTFQPIWLFQGIERMGYITLFLVLARTSYVVLALLWIRKPSDYYLVAVANGTAQLLGAILAIVLMIRLGYKPVWPGWRFIRSTLSDSIGFFWSRAAVSIYTAGASFYLGIVSTPAHVAFYSAAEQLYKGGQTLFQPLNQALFPHMARTKDIRLFFRVLKLVMIISGAGALTGWLFGEMILMTLFGNDFSSSYGILSIFMLALCITTPSALLGYPFLAALGDSRSANHSVILGALFLILILLGTWTVDITSAFAIASSILIAELFVLFYRIWKSKSLLSTHIVINQ